MINFKKNWWKILTLALVATFIDIAGHLIEGTPLPNEPLTIIARTIGIEATASVYFIILFSSISITFLMIEKWLPGGRIKKGLAYGIPWALIMYAAVCETNVLLGTPVIADIRMGFVDAIPLIVLGLLLGKLLTSDSQSNQPRNKINLLTFLIITIFYIIGRYFAYSILKIESGYIERPISTFFWTFSMGIIFGILYLLVGRYVNRNNPIKKAIIFGVGIVGINWLIGYLFFPLVFQDTISRILFNAIGGRALVDIVFITLGTYIGESLLNKNAAKIRYS